MSALRTQDVHFDKMVPNYLEIVCNKAMCKKCEEVIESTSGHGFKTCSCGSLSVDGGLFYLKRLGNRSDYREMSLYGYKIPKYVAQLPKEVNAELVEPFRRGIGIDCTTFVI